MKVNKSDCLEYYAGEQRFKFMNDSKELLFNTSDIALVELFKSYPLHKKSFSYFSWTNYHYAKIHLHNGNKITITSLLIGGEIMFNVCQNIVSKPRFFCYVRNSCNK